MPTLPDILKDNVKGLNPLCSGDYLPILKVKAAFGDCVNIIQHPKGRRKEIVLSNNRVTDISENFIMYEADADFSSSGSPVMNQQWQLVALHRGVLYKKESDPVEKKESDPAPVKLIVEGEIGIRVSKIIEFIVNDLHNKIEEYNNNIGKYIAIRSDL